MSDRSMTTEYLPKTLPAFIWHAIRPQKIWFLLNAILPCAWAIDQIIFPYCTKLLIDTITHYSGDRGNIFHDVAPILLLGLGAWILLLLIWRFLDIVDVYFIPKFQATLRFQMLEYIQQHSHKYFSDEFSGRMANKISDMANDSWEILNFIFRNFMPVSVSILASVFILGTVSKMFSVIFILFYFAHLTICLILSKKCEHLSDIHSEAKSTLQGNIVDSLSNVINVRLFSRQKYELDYMSRFQNIEIKAHKKLLWSLFQVRLILEVPSFLMIAGIVYFLILGWQNGTVTPGDFAFVITLSFSVMMSLWRLGWELPSFFKHIGTCQQALSLIRTPHEITDSPHAPELRVSKGEIVFDKVHFHYIPGYDLFKNKNITIHSGEKVGLVGFSGSGKSTFVNLILRYFDLEQGQILIDGQNIAKVTQNSLRGKIAMIPQDVTLFHRSLKENIRYGNLEATDEAIIEASKQAFCDDFIQHLELGYDTLVGERGIKLSGGQRQRIAIARAILKNAPILILDEATSALDSMTEKQIQDSLKHLMKGRTTIVIAHRLSTLLGMDKILVFDRGEIIEQGDHLSLLRQQGHYAKLWQMQAGGFLPDQPLTWNMIGE